VTETEAPAHTTLYRCITPTNVLCPCGKVARRLHDAGIEFEEIRVPMRKTRRAEVIELTGQNVVPVLMHEGEAIHDSKRIVEYLDSLDGKVA
jgi:glutathione S-transferase